MRHTAVKGMAILVLGLVAVATGPFRGLGVAADVAEPPSAAEPSVERVVQATPSAVTGAPGATVSGASQEGKEGGRRGQTVEGGTSRPPDVGKEKEGEETAKSAEQGEAPGRRERSELTAPVQPEAGETQKAPGETEQDHHPGKAEPGHDRARKAEPPPVEPASVRTLTGIEPGHNDSHPVWSPTGELIAFERSIGDGREIVVCRLDGSSVHRIFHRTSETDQGTSMFLSGVLDDASFNSGISWSPDGKSLVFMSNGGRGNYDIYLVPSLGSQAPIRLTENSERDSDPQWSPVANEVIFVSGRGGKADLYLMNIDTRALSKLTEGQKSHLYPQWSPDGKKIVMIYGSNDNHDVYLIEDVTRPTATLRALTTWAFDDLRPVWSPDGKRIAFYSNYNPQNEPKVWSIHVIPVDGSGYSNAEALPETVVATDVIPDIEQGPAWMPDSKRIVYVKNDQESFNPIYIVDLDDRSNVLIKTETKMNHDVSCSRDGLLAYRAQVDQWDHIYIMSLKR